MHANYPARFSAARDDGTTRYIRRPMPPTDHIQDAVNQARGILTFTEACSIMVAFVLGGSCSAIWMLRQKRWPNWREVTSTILLSAGISVAIICAFLHYAQIPMLLVIPTSILSGFGGEILGRALVNLWIEAMTRLFGPKFLSMFGLKSADTRKTRQHESDEQD